MKSVIVDTNVFVSALIGSKVCKQIYELLKLDNFELVVSNDLLTEISTVLTRVKLELSKDEVEETIWHIRQKGRKVIPAEKILLSRDPKDNIVLECTTVVKVDFIVTGDKDLLSLKKFRNIPIITPKKFIQLLNK
jgi:putative PIN family toxin of toxin-antitoxin system